jgi:hypothetical protein
MSEQIEQLKADIAALEAAQNVMRKHGGYASELAKEIVVQIQDEIKELEKQAADPWQDAKEYLIAMESPLSASYWQNVVAKYVRHLEEKVKQLENTAIPAETFNRAALQRRIKHQRRELRMLNRGMHRQALEIKSYEQVNSDLHRNKGYLMGEIVKHQEKIRSLESEIKGMKAMKS